MSVRRWCLYGSRRQTSNSYYFAISYSALKFFKNIQFYFAVSSKNSNPNSIIYPLIEYLITKVRYPYPMWKHVALFYSKRWLLVLALHFIKTSLSDGK